jgi:hypothetical protein
VRLEGRKAVLQAFISILARPLRPSHPIRWAWNTWERRRGETAERLAQREFTHLVVFRLRRPGEVTRAIDFLVSCLANEVT